MREAERYEMPGLIYKLIAQQQTVVGVRVVFPEFFDEFEKLDFMMLFQLFGPFAQAGPAQVFG